MTGVVTFAHAHPFTQAELDDFEQAILACQNRNRLVAELAKTSLGAMVQHHGVAKCNLMMHALNHKHGTEDTQQ
ncbi:hypothetical protein ACRQ5Q_24435 [Bradyrhizobium sp. PMVTL-01]|uniref:hypothetical protein n=1 Tax=Bradyrhizobium sp. PMVTL-01 TaxID=3434999 RepID=UPI003F7239C8